MAWQDTTIGGRPARVTSLGRVRSKVGRSFYDLMSVRFLDNGEYHSMGAAEFERWATRMDRQARNAPCETCDRKGEVQVATDGGEFRWAKCRSCKGSGRASHKGE